MYRRFAVISVIIGLFFFLLGAAALGWALAGQKKEKQLLQEQQKGFNDGWNNLDKVVSGKIDVRSFANLVPHKNQQQESDKYRSQIEMRELVFSVSIVSILLGAAILSWWLLLWTARLLIRIFPYLAKLFLAVFRRYANKQHAEANTREEKKTVELQQRPGEHRSWFKKRSKILAGSGWHDFGENLTDKYEPASSEEFSPVASKPKAEKLFKDTGKVAVLLSGEESVEDSFSKSAMGNLNVNKKLSDRSCKTIGRTALEHSEPLKDNLNELLQQVSAIREYASQQQGRMEKLQDGYDWNIIRTFCLRIIRCIDNLENRIARLSKENVETTELEQVRDELVFALESSGVEQFEPEINSEYRGQERKAEAVKNKERCDKPNLTGKIAKVVRPGYQYVIDEENVKVVRTAQVKLFA